MVVGKNGTSDVFQLVPSPLRQRSVSANISSNQACSRSVSRVRDDASRNMDAEPQQSREVVGHLERHRKRSGNIEAELQRSREVAEHLERHRERLLGLRDEAAQASAAALQELEAALRIERSREATAALAVGERMDGLEVGKAAATAVFERFMDRSRQSALRPALIAWRLLIRWASAERRGGALRSVLCHIQDRTLRALLRRRRQELWHLARHVCCSWRNRAHMQNWRVAKRKCVELSRRQFASKVLAAWGLATAQEKASSRFSCKCLDWREQQSAMICQARTLAAWAVVIADCRAIGSASAEHNRVELDPRQVVSKVLTAWRLATVRKKSSQISRKHLYLRVQQSLMTCQAKTFAAWSVAVANRQAVRSARAMVDSRAKQASTICLRAWAAATVASRSVRFMRESLIVKMQSQYLYKLLVRHIHSWGKAARNASAANSLKHCFVECSAIQAAVTLECRVFAAWSSAARKGSAAIEPCCTQEVFALVTKAFLAWSATTARATARRAKQQAECRTIEATAAMGAAEARLLEIAGAESRLSRARVEVREQVEALRSAVAVGAPPLLLQRALLLWRFSMDSSVKKQPCSPSSSLSDTPVSPRQPRPPVRRPAVGLTPRDLVTKHQALCRRAWSVWREVHMYCKRQKLAASLAQWLERRTAGEWQWQLSILLAAWRISVQPAQRSTDSLRAEAARRVESAKRTMEAAEKAALLGCVVKAWADWAASSYAARWLDLLQTGNQLLPKSHPQTTDSGSWPTRIWQCLEMDLEPSR